MLGVVAKQQEQKLHQQPLLAVVSTVITDEMKILNVRQGMNHKHR